MGKGLRLMIVSIVITAIFANLWLGGAMGQDQSQDQSQGKAGVTVAAAGDFL
ncbi:hypothetical protein ACFPL7_05400 [Dongia soli]|uniref:Uncharacterized protein n=1 Tax=Dongia soli TaxID=600628 RepID=A0ABU5EFF4_9PROT|nr:hypothetical protein [Dongia soli]MDY0884835.1 hypothetical protein [Dongia soli]